MQVQQKHIFLGGLNTDDDPRLLPEGDYRFAENVRTLSSEVNHQGVAENVLGNQQVASPSGFSDTTFAIIGSYEDRARQHTYFFACDVTAGRNAASRKHTIFRYDGLTNQISAVLSTATLNFSTAYRITHAAIIENLLYWTDNYNPVRQINVDTAGGKTYPISEFHLSLGKYPPFAPLYAAVTQRPPSVNPGKLKQLVQLTYRFVYQDGQKSSFAPYSLVQHGYTVDFVSIDYSRFGAVYGLSASEAAANGGLNFIALDSDRFADQIRFVEIYARESEYLPFKLMRRIRVSEERAAPGDYEITEDTTTLAVAATAEISQLFDSVPLKSGTLHTEDNRIFLGDNLEDFPDVSDFAVEQVEKYYNGSWHNHNLNNDTVFLPLTLTDPQLGQWLSFKAGGIYQLGVVFYDELNRSSLVYTNEALKVKFDQVASLDLQALISAASARFGYPTQSIDRLGINTTPFVVQFSDDNNPGLGYYDGSNDNYSPLTGIHEVSVAGTYNVTGRLAVYHRNTLDRDLYIRLFVNGAQRAEQRFTQATDTGGRTDRYNFFFINQGFSLGDQITIRVSREAGSYRSELQRSSDTFCEIKLTDALTTTVPIHDCAVGFRFPSSFRPPEWAVGYQIVRTNCLNYDFFIQGFTGKFYWYQTDPADENIRKRIETYTNADQDKASHMYIRIKQWYSDAYSVADKSQSNPPNEVYYNFQQGDKIAFYLDGKRYEFDIIEFADESIVIRRPFDSATLAIPEQTSLFVEVYRELKINDQAKVQFYEVGDWYPVLNPKTPSRAWSKSDWTYVDNDTIARTLLPGGYVVNQRYPFSFGDVHVIKKQWYIEGSTNRINGPEDETPVYTQSMHPDVDRIWDRWEHGSGRPNVAYTEPASQKQKTTQIRFSETFVTDSKINNTNRYYEFNQNSLPASYGAIRAMRRGQDDGLESAGGVMIVLTENECVSVYINRRRLEDLNGNTSIVASDNVIGSWNTIKGSYGCSHPESVVEYGGNVYYYAQNKGVVARYGRDGLTPISEYKMRNFFYARAQFLVSGHQVVGGFDPYHQQYVLSFVDPRIVERATVAFNERANRWESFYTFIPEVMGTNGTRLLSYRNGGLYVHGKGAYNTYYGQKSDSQMGIVTNVSPSDVKVFQNISEESTHVWAVQRFTTPEGQLSRLVQTKFVQKENVYYAQILRDLTSPGPFPIVNGRVMRSTVLETLLVLDPEVVTKSLLFAVNVYSIKSQLSNQA